MRAHILLAVSLALVSGCSLRPLYAGGGDGAVARALESIEVRPIEGRAGWLVRTAIEDRLPRPSGSARYKLNIALDDAITGFGVRSDNAITRERRTLRARYQLVDAGGATLIDATAASDAGIDVVGSEYATIAAEETVLERLAADLADQIVRRLAQHSLGQAKP